MSRILILVGLVIVVGMGLIGFFRGIFENFAPDVMSSPDIISNIASNAPAGISPGIDLGLIPDPLLDNAVTSISVPSVIYARKNKDDLTMTSYNLRQDNSGNVGKSNQPFYLTQDAALSPNIIDNSYKNLLINSNVGLNLVLNYSDLPFTIYYYYSNDKPGDIKLKLDGEITRYPGSLISNNNKDALSVVSVDKNKALSVTVVSLYKSLYPLKAPVTVVPRSPVTLPPFTVPNEYHKHIISARASNGNTIQKYSITKDDAAKASISKGPNYLTQNSALTTTTFDGTYNNTCINSNQSFTLDIKSANLPFSLYNYCTNNNSCNVTLKINGTAKPSVAFPSNLNTDSVNFIYVDTSGNLSTGTYDHIYYPYDIPSV